MHVPVLQMREKFRDMIKSYLEANLASLTGENREENLLSLANEEEHAVLTETNKIISYRTAILRKVNSGSLINSMKFASESVEIRRLVK